MLPFGILNVLSAHVLKENDVRKNDPLRPHRAHGPGN